MPEDLSGLDRRSYEYLITSQCRRFWAEGTDNLEIIVKAGRKHDRKVYASVSMNDGHFVSDNSKDLIEWC